MSVGDFDSDRTIHAEFEDEKIVRYDRAGKWYIEFDPPNLRSCRLVGVQEAARRALDLSDLGGSIYFGRHGGAAFERHVDRFDRMRRAAHA